VTAAERNRETYERLWPSFGDFIRYNPGARHRRRAILELIGRCAFESVLDVGCGDGALLAAIDERFPGRSCTGVDLAPSVIEANRRRLPHMRFETVHVEADELPGSYDLVVCSEVIEHLDDGAAAIRRLAAACAPGGHVVVTCPTGRLYETERRFGHVRHPRPDELRRWAVDAGLEAVEMRCWGFPVYAATKWATNIDPDRALKAFGAGRYGLAQIAVSTALYAANFVNLKSSPLGVQLFALLRRSP
jgi:SAM-dependent methyltransferase